MRRTPLLHRLLGLPPPNAGKITVHADLQIPMRDGVVLHADRIVPDGGGDAPVLLLRSAYGRGQPWRSLYGRTFAAYGYQVVIASCRGTGDTGGRPRPFDERDDGVDTIAWLREQPWYQGRLVLAAPSYFGMAQWALVDAVPSDELLAIVAILTSSRLVRAMFSGGALSLTWLGWSAMVAAQQDRGPGVMTLLLARTIHGRRLARAYRHLPLSEADRVASGRTLAWWQQWLAHPDPDDAYWQHRDWSDAVSRVAAPVAMVTSWHDHFLPWQLTDWAQLPSDTPRRLVIGPWVHEDPKLLRLYLREAVTWIDTHVRGSASGREDAAVRYYVTGVDQWRDASVWPPPGCVDQRWYLHAGGGLSTARPSPAPPSRYRYDPADPTPAVGGPWARGNPRKRQDKVEARGDVVCFTSDPLREPLELVGAARATVHLRSSVAHTDVVVRVCDVDARGRSYNVCDGIRRAHVADLVSDADDVRAVDVDLWPAAHRFDRGHRLRIQIASAAFPRFARNPGTGEPPTTATRLVVADQQIHHAPAHPSHIILPTMPAPPAH